MTQIAIKFVQWEVPALVTLQNSRAYILRESQRTYSVKVSITAES